MRIAALTIKNFRSFGPCPVTMLFDYRMNTFIGLNSCGKTTTMDALRKLFGKYNDQQFCREDFHIGKDEEPSKIGSIELFIEAKLEFKEKEEAISTFFSDMVISKPGDYPYVRLRISASWKKSLISEQGDIESNLSFVLVGEGEKEDMQSQKGCPPHYRKLFEIFYVPAIRKPAEQLKYASGSILYRVLNNLKYTDDFIDQFDQKIEEINLQFKDIEGFDTIQEALQRFWGHFHKDDRYQDAILSFASSDLESVLKKLEIHFGPGHNEHRKFKVDDLGDGYRSLFYITLVCSLLDLESKIKVQDSIDELQRPLLTIVAIEEPENHIAPQLLGRVIKILTDITLNDNTQIFLSSHTPAIVKRIEPESLYHFRIAESSYTEVNRITLPDKKDEAYKYIKEAVQNCPEIYFAKLVLIGEGDSEEVIFTRLMKVLNKDFDDNFITFAPLGHRFVNHIWELLSSLSIPYVTLLDLDLEREGGGWGRIKYALKQLIATGVDKKELLGMKGGTVLSDDQLDKMHERDYSAMRILNAWLKRLEKYNVYFSFPLDIDFLMLEAFTSFYTDKKSHPGGDGPSIPDKVKDKAKFEKYLLGAVRATLKSDDTNGDLYTPEQKELMIWYRYHFLGRGKPSTHITVLPEIEDKTIKDNLPKVFVDIFKALEKY
jgi:predicted ATP-dependent endonuclease of OLD family